MIKQPVRLLLTGKGPNFSNLTAKECGIGEYRLRYKLPGNPINTGRPKKPTPERVNLQRNIFDSYRVQQKFNRTFVQMEFEWWAYRGLFLQGYFGRLGDLSVTIDVNRAEAHIPLVDGGLDSLEVYLKKDLWEYYETEKNKDGKPGANWEQRNRVVDNNPYAQAQALQLVHLPEVYEREKINGVEWLQYQINGEGIPGPRYTYYWAYPLTDSYYLTFSFWLTTEIGNRDMRAQRMYEDAKRIMSMVELSKE
ncbi:hypothetical protein HCH_03292 [Hahella chejuensis KCTC 2396]|uniref:Tle cognate immunity protein 4 C-terminal domain-containing protein n=1 Tax=Hahella chejuensis (strain KCTC 2396) TaxID=349521 RepID=Q2SH27_HAHCH|nr:hypothetical protein [Hahella chejuensis]ABC30047.1 hypothetical protein HCH_03292 [Hahella chejuensis KCTC 2396]